MAEKILELKGIKKSFGDNKVIDGLSVDVMRGEFLTILGPSGCGKTTLLRIIAGLTDADDGRVLISGEDVTVAEPNRRNVNTVFQSYALFPHMTVEKNVAYPLRMKRTPVAEIKKRVSDALELVQMSGFEKRYPASLSGGQRQRVAIARAVVGESDILLLDEPLGALDLNLRRQMQSELKRIQKTLGITFIYITHDQEEALTMSDRVAVMHRGRFLQIGTPDEVYDSPSSVYVARFVGDANIIPADFIKRIDGGAAVSFAGGELLVRGGDGKQEKDIVNVAVRAENVRFIKDPLGNAAVSEVSFAGGVMHITAELGACRITSVRYGLDRSFGVGERVRVEIDEMKGVICEADSDCEDAK